VYPDDGAVHEGAQILAGDAVHIQRNLRLDSIGQIALAVDVEEIKVGLARFYGLSDGLIEVSIINAPGVDLYRAVLFFHGEGTFHSYLVLRGGNRFL
jgi:hypothetical protein